MLVSLAMVLDSIKPVTLIEARKERGGLKPKVANNEGIQPIIIKGNLFPITSFTLLITSEDFRNV